jgi:hypothetical protein
MKIDYPLRAQKYFPIRSIYRGQLGIVTIDGTDYTVLGTNEGVAFLDDGDFMLRGSQRLLQSSLQFSLLPPGTVLNITV